MLAPAVLLLALGLPQESGPDRIRTEVTTEEIDRVLAEAESARERAMAALKTDDPATARAEADRAIALLAPLPIDEAYDEVADILWDAGYVSLLTDSLVGAREAYARVLEHRERTLPADHQDLIAVQNNVALTMRMMGDLHGARVLQEAVLEARERTLPAHHPDLLGARQNLAFTMAAMGDLPGARALEEVVLEARERTLPADHPALLTARSSLALTMRKMGDLSGARALQTAVMEVYERTLPADHPDLLAVQSDLARTMQEMGDLTGARALREAVLEARERTLPAGDPILLTARASLAHTMGMMGDLPGARALQEAVLETYERTLPADHPKLLAARQSLGRTMRRMGDFSGARALHTGVLEAYERTRPPDHPDLLRARLNLAATMLANRDLAEARGLLEVALEACEHTLPADNPNLLGVRSNLASTMFWMGDLLGARALQEAVLETYERTLPADHRDLLAARLNLAITLKEMNDLTGARVLEESVLAGFERTLPEGHPDLLMARGNTSSTMAAMGDLSGARALLESVLDDRERTLPADHPDILRVQSSIAGQMWEMGDLADSRALSETVLQSYARTMPAGHPDLLDAMGNLAGKMHAMGDLASARAQGIDLCRGVLRRLELASTLSPREARAVVGSEALRHGRIRFYMGVGESEDASLRFELAETLRAVASVGGATTGEGDPRRREISNVRARLNDLVSGGPGDERSPEEFAEDVARLTLERDRLERAIRGDLTKSGELAGSIRATGVASALPEGSAAVGFLRHRKWKPGEESSTSGSDVLVAHVVQPDGTLFECELGSAHELEELVRTWRSALGQPVASRGARVQRGVAVLEGGEEGDQAGKELEAGDVLRARIVDPLIDRLGEDVTTLHVCLEDFLYLLPIDALPLGSAASDGRVRDRFRIVNEVSFARLLVERPPAAGDPTLLAMGAAEFEGRESELRGSGHAETFTVLPETRGEVESVGGLFERSHGQPGSLLMEGKATKEAVHEQAPGKRYLHVATHGWFAPETIPSTLDARDDSEALWSRMGAQEAVTGLAPMTLCGLAFAGANQGRDSLGRVPGIMTAEELAGIDLSACDLAVLSACETNVGIRRAGQGIQSLQTALHAAGARTAITSLWKVDDAATRRLFEIFYTKLWVEGLGKADALWQAKMALRSEGHPTRDWAGWVLTGDPN